MHESISYSNNFLNNTLVTKTKTKDDNGIKGITTVELYSKDGELQQKVVSENSFLNGQFKNALRKFLLTYKPGSGQTQNLTWGLWDKMFYKFYVSDNDELENPDRLFFNEDGTHSWSLLGWATTSEAYSGADMYRGSVNITESYYTIPDFVNKKIKHRFVFDFPTNACNGVIKKVGFIGKNQDNAEFCAHNCVVSDTVYVFDGKRFYNDLDPSNNSSLLKCGNYFIGSYKYSNKMAFNSFERVVNNLPPINVELPENIKKYIYTAGYSIQRIKIGEEYCPFITYTGDDNNGGIKLHKVDLQTGIVDETPILLYLSDGSPAGKRNNKLLINIYQNFDGENIILMGQNANGTKDALYEIKITDLSLIDSEHKIIVNAKVDDISNISVFDKYNSIFGYTTTSFPDANRTAYSYRLDCLTLKDVQIYNVGSNLFAFKNGELYNLTNTKYLNGSSTSIPIILDDTIAFISAGGSNMNVSYLSICAATENLLPEPITKSDQNTMKIKYDIEIDM